MSYRVYFGRLPETLSQDEFEKLLEEHGKAKNIEWNSGYAYVDYRHGSDASNTVQNLNGKEIGGNNILVELAQNGIGGYSIAGGFSARMKTPLPRPVRTPHRVRIENLSSRAKWMELKELLSLAGEVTFADTHKRKHGEGIVEFASRRDLTHAIKMFDKTLFFGKTIRIYDESPENRSRGRDESRSHSRSPRRRSSPGSRGKKNKRSRSRSGSTNRKKSPSKRGSESRKNASRSISPQRRSRKQKHNKSRSASPSPHKYHHHSRLPPKSSRHSPKKAKKSKRDESRSNSRSPKRKRKHKEERRSEKRKHKRSHSSSSSENDIVSKKKTKNPKKKKHSSNSESKSDSDSSSSSKEDSESDHTK